MSRFIHNLDDLPPDITVALFGAGGVGAYTLRQLNRERSDIRVLCFFDEHKSGTHEELPIRGLSEMRQTPVDLVLITSSYWKEIETTLQNADWDRYAVADLLGEHESRADVREIVVRGSRLCCHVPNRILQVIADNFELIEPKTLDWIDSLPPGAVFYDIGASSGIFSVYAAVASACHVVAFEPDAQNFAALEMNHFLNRSGMAQPITSINLALSDAPGVGQLRCLNYVAGSHGKTLARPVEQHSPEAQQPSADQQVDHIQHVLTDFLDHVCDHYRLPMPQYMKIDIDGAELSLLQGAEKVLADSRLKQILMEVSDPDGAGKSAAELPAKYGFRLHERHAINEITGSPVSGVENLLFVRD